MGLRCVNCGSTVNALFIQYSPGNIRLTKCTNCNAVADEYIESEMMILLIDLILHKPKAYCHLFFNLPHQNKLNIQVLVWKAVLLFMLLDACRQLALKPIKVDSESFGSPLPQLLVASGKLMINVLWSNLIFFCALLLAVKLLQKRQANPEINFLLVRVEIVNLHKHGYDGKKFSKMALDRLAICNNTIEDERRIELSKPYLKVYTDNLGSALLKLL